MSQETVSIRLEGGVGDHLLSNRFIAAIKEKHPDAQLNFYSDTENNYKQINLLKYAWPSIYTNNNCKVIETRKSKDFKVKSQFGEEVYNCHLNNLPDQYIRLFNDSDYFYNLCIDNLDWIHYSFDWKRYFYFFPRPEINSSRTTTNDSFILTHLYPRPNSDHNVEQWYAIALIKKLLESGKQIVSVCQQEYMRFYQEIIDLKHPNFTLTDCSLEGFFKLSEACSAFVGVDSGLRYFPLHYGKPTYVFSKYCKEPFQTWPSHVLRWLIFEKYVLPMHYDVNYVSSIVINSTQHPAFSLFPQFSDNLRNLIIERNYV
jgi:ADP-heptose:LPS heptosyltransferase